MRERYLEAFDAVRIDCLNGDKYKTGKVAPDGSPDPSIFSTESDPVGIQVGTAIATLVRKADHKPTDAVGFRHLWGQAKPEKLTATAEAAPDTLYKGVAPVLPLGLPFVRTAVSEDWFDWPSLPDLFPVSFPGVKTSRDGFLVDIDLDRLRARVGDYFDASLSHEEIVRRYPAAMKTTARFDAPAVRDALLKHGGPEESGFIQYAYRPFDNRWLYWEENSALLDRPRTDYRQQVFEGNSWIEARERETKEDFSRGTLVSQMADNFGNGLSSYFPAWLQDDSLGTDEAKPRRPNLTPTAQRYLDRLGLCAEDLFHHVLAILHDPAYREANAGALRMEWPRIVLPGYPNGGDASAAETLRRSAALGHELAALLDPETSVPGVTQTPLRPEIAAVAVPTTAEGRNMAGKDFAITAGWGRHGQGDAVMPGQGNAVERAFTPEERAAMSDSLPQLGETTFDVHLNANAFWRNVPAAVWHYTLGGYQVLKKWLSYREHSILQRPSRPEEVQQFAEIARRIAAILKADIENGPIQFDHR